MAFVGISSGSSPIGVSAMKLFVFLPLESSGCSTNRSPRMELDEVVAVLPARFLSSSFSLSRSLELMYISPLELRPVFLPQLSPEDLLCSSGDGTTPGSIDKLPILLASSLSLDPEEPREDGREELRRNLSGLDSRAFGEVNGEKPDGGFEVRMIGGLAASSSKDSSATPTSFSDG